MDSLALGKKAIAAKSKSLAQYSNFHVGAALKTKSGKIYEGANIESSSYSLTICAERTAVFQAILEGEREFDSIAIASDAKEFCPPCGACRQVLLDLCGKDLDIILINSKEEIIKYKITELIPHSFGEDFLK
ncbi:MAG: cytidine deaminase [Melioribacteraceae bacterium]|jgi:cytidine deaminase|nr:cytidine deaminase [Melioribacteraceae bacterium]RJP63414.1 MAG: cytidine deaminase [Ignavibacteriales bacterium]WKZ68162.1 MAG: cytidine deaminase [Melioribacteraceae bacterium]